MSAVSEQVQVISGTAALAVWANRDVLCARAGRSGVLHAEQIVIARYRANCPCQFVVQDGATQCKIRLTDLRFGETTKFAGMR
jgi:hypothetical protein